MLAASAAAAARVLCLPLLPALLAPLREPVRVRLRMGDLPRLPSLCPEALSPALASPRLLSCLPALLPPPEGAACTLSTLISLTPQITRPCTLYHAMTCYYVCVTETLMQYVMTRGGRDKVLTSLWQVVDLQLRSVLHRQCDCLQVVTQAGSGLPDLNLLSFLLASLQKGKLASPRTCKQ